jgi:hypothetical protein
MQEMRDFTLGLVLGHQLEDMQAFWPPGMQSFAYSIGLKKQFSRFLPPKKSIFFIFDLSRKLTCGYREGMGVGI